MDVANQILVLASQRVSGHVTGQIVRLHGGMEGEARSKSPTSLAVDISPFAARPLAEPKIVLRNYYIALLARSRSFPTLHCRPKVTNSCLVSCFPPHKQYATLSGTFQPPKIALAAAT